MCPNLRSICVKTHAKSQLPLETQPASAALTQHIVRRIQALPSQDQSYRFFFFPFHPICHLRPSFSLLPCRNSDPGQIAGASPPLPPTVRALHFYPAKISALSSLVGSLRIVLTHARRCQQLVLFLFLEINSESHHGVIRTHGPTLVAFEGYH